MWKQYVNCTYIFILSFLISLKSMGQNNPSEQTYFIKVDPAGTYLYTNRTPYDPNPEVQIWLPKDMAYGPSYFDFTALFLDPISPLKEGDILSFELVGAASFVGETPDNVSSLAGVFHGDDFYEPGSFTNAPEFFSRPTAINQRPTDISQDFAIPFGREVYAQIPKGAKRVLFTVDDTFFSDNSDPNGDFGVWIKIKVIKYKLTVKFINTVNGQDYSIIDNSPETSIVDDGDEINVPLGGHFAIHLHDLNYNIVVYTKQFPFLKLKQAHLG